MTMHVIVAGGGKVGVRLATLLLASGHRVSVVEARSEEVSPLRSELPPDVVVRGDGTDPTVLERCGIRRADVVAAVTGDDETNLVIASLARAEFNVPRVIARVNNPKNAWLFTPEMGVDVALNQADLMAHLIVEEMSLGDMMTLLKLRRGQYSLVEEKVHPQAAAAGRALRDLDLPRHCTLAAVIREGDLLIPHGDLVLQPADEVLAVVHASQAAQLAAILGPRAPRAGGASRGGAHDP
jgi:trk system potassium uptake protein